MAEIKASLRKRLHQQFMMLFAGAFVVAVASILYFVDAQNKASVEQKLRLSHDAVEQAFNAYLVRSEFEMSFISQDLILGQYEPGRELEMLFNHHEILFFGGLDFFYVEWSDGRRAIDPRARLFTKVSLTNLIAPAEISQWIKRTTSDGASLLIYKKKLISKESENVGYLYGFVSLNGNLTLAHELLVSAQADMVRIYDQANGRILLEEQESDFAPSLSLLRSLQPLKTPVLAKLQLEISQRGNLTGNVLSKSLVPIVVILLVLLVLCCLLMMSAKYFIFTPLKRVQTASPSHLPFNEFQPIQQQNNHYRALIEGKDRRFHVLLEASDSVIIFCSEVAEIEMINGHGKKLFPDHERAKTIFDFMPIHCHQPIKDALKGATNIAFELTFQEVGQIYHWQVMSFRNEYAYRGLLLLGKNMTREIRLTWQLEQLDPNSDFMQSRAEGAALLEEMSYVANYPSYEEGWLLQGWLGLLVSVFEDLKAESAEETLQPLGELLRQESTQVMTALNANNMTMRLDCTIDTGAQFVPNSPLLRSLMRVLMMRSCALDKPMKVAFENNLLVLHVSPEVVSRSLFTWLVTTLLEKMDGQQELINSTSLRLDVGIPRAGTGEEPQALNLVVAWVTLDYPNADEITAMLTKLGAKVECYADADSFFTQSRLVARFDVVLIACGQDYVAQQKMTQSLYEQYGAESLPLLWLNAQPVKHSVVEGVLALTGSVFEYHLYKGLLEASAKGAISPSAFGDKGQVWLVVGGSRVSRAIWFSALEMCSAPSHWLESLAAPSTLLSYYSDAVVVLLEPQDAQVIAQIQENYPQVTFVALHPWPQGIPKNVTLFEMNTPYSSEQITALNAYVRKANNIIEE